MSNKVISIIGGDERQIYLTDNLIENGFIVKIIGFENRKIENDNLIICDNLEEVLSNTDIAILGIPYSKNFNEIYAPFSDKKLYLDDFFELISSNTNIYGGALKDTFLSKAKSKNIKVYDYTKDDLFSYLNAIPTAEGAIKEIINNSVITVDSMNCLITGFGKTAKILAKKLKDLNCNITIAARNKSQLNEALALGYNICPIKNINNIINNYNTVINTVPALIFDKYLLQNMDNNTLLIDIASLPGGIDFKEASELNIKAIQALGIPAKEFPKTAGDILYRAIINKLEEE